MKDKDYVDLASVYSDQVIAEGYNYKDPKWKEYRKKTREQNPDLPALRAKAKKDNPSKVSGDAESRYDEPYRKAERDKFNSSHHRAAQSKMQGDYEWTSEGLRELEPAELLEFISDALPKFLQTNFNPEDYDEIRSKLYSAAELLNDPYGPGGQEYDAAHGGNVGNMPGEDDDRSWQDQPGVYPPGYNQ